jgi:hypothetical protein
MVTEPPVPSAGRQPLRIACWTVRDTGLLTAPGPFRRLAGAIRHHRGQGPGWPDAVTLEVDDGELRVEGVGGWPLAEVAVQVLQAGPPVTFVLRVPGSAHLLATAAGADADAALATIGADA